MSPVSDSATFMIPSLSLGLSRQDAVIFAAGAGLACHFAFKSMEPRRPLAHAVLLLVAPFVLSLILEESFEHRGQAFVLTFGIYLASLVTSLVVYRLSPFHPLARYPGPILCKLSKLWLAYKCLSGKQHIYYEELHNKYGPVVRTGPNELSFCDASVIAPLMGPNGLPKGPIWEGRRLSKQKTKTLIALTDAKDHARRRKPWLRGLNSTALKDYEIIIERRTSQLVSALAAQKGAVDMTQWISFFAYDFMSDMAFGGGSEMMSSGDTGGLWHMLENGLADVLPLGHVPWVTTYYRMLPGLGKNRKRFQAFAVARAQIRKAEGSMQKDLFHYLFNEDGAEATPPPMHEGVSDGALAIVAGSDTTATAIATVIWYLLQNRAAYTRLQAEIDANFPPGEEPTNTTRQAGMSYLNAVINEALRLFPPVLGGSQRAVPQGAGAKAIGPHVLPEGTVAFVHFYSIHRRPEYFSPMPDAFIPERWLPADQPGSLHSPDYKGDVRHDTSAFVPFSFGPAICAGKTLAYQEMRLVLCWLLQQFDMRFADGFVPEKWEEDLRDCFLTIKGPLLVSLTPRNAS
ncbi:hypothetical protein PLICRDRAFT_432908 [Plicaturopsis crispa FD-325 SS-3]|uniref:High nitrogen upregulated cytochrome P450 monooxygenase 2 n=1 Tax=Plicaturopsis crispa FD-325 SS-3 TaxID=944288 RepID=A0A0C9T731_PLICR|nr:hypothetical protein PLICRDRAFT_432908 [Plicaturopsis crispa FD-325 SS-3]